MKKTFVIALVGLSLVACNRQPRYTRQYVQPVQTQQVEQEDCDFGDMMERDEDCGFKKKHKKPKYKYGKPYKSYKSYKANKRRH